MGINLVHSVVNIIALLLIGGCIVIILKQLAGVREEDLLKSPHIVVGISEVVAATAAQIDADQSPIVVIGRVIDAIRAASDQVLLVQSEASGSIVLAGNNRVRIAGTGEPAHQVIAIRC